MFSVSFSLSCASFVQAQRLSPARTLGVRLVSLLQPQRVQPLYLYPAHRLHVQREL